MTPDIWHFPRVELATQVLSLFEVGLSNALIFFAPRRMGKTEFLRKDITPLALKKGWKVFYLSFLDIDEPVLENFTKALQAFCEEIKIIKSDHGVLSRVKKAGTEAFGMKAHLEFESKSTCFDLKTLFLKLSLSGKILLLMDEIQILTKTQENEQFIATFRTALDMYKDQIKVIFTGSSREGLRRMFSQASAPFFHFGQNLPFPEFGPDFTHHLSKLYEKITQRKIEEKILWEAFVDMDKIPQLARSLVERLILNPNLSVQQAKTALLEDIFNDRAFVEMWEHSSKLEQILLKAIATGISELFGEEKRMLFAKQLGISALKVSSVQSAIRVLQKKQLIGKLPEQASYYIDDPNFNTWLSSVNE